MVHSLVRGEGGVRGERSNRESMSRVRHRGNIFECGISDGTCPRDNERQLRAGQSDIVRDRSLDGVHPGVVSDKVLAYADVALE